MCAAAAASFANNQRAADENTFTTLFIQFQFSVAMKPTNGERSAGKKLLTFVLINAWNFSLEFIL